MTATKARDARYGMVLIGTILTHTEHATVEAVTAATGIPPARVLRLHRGKGLVTGVERVMLERLLPPPTLLDLRARYETPTSGTYWDRLLQGETR